MLSGLNLDEDRGSLFSSSSIERENSYTTTSSSQSSNNPLIDEKISTIRTRMQDANRTHNNSFSHKLSSLKNFFKFRKSKNNGDHQILFDQHHKKLPLHIKMENGEITIRSERTIRKEIYDLFVHRLQPSRKASDWPLILLKVKVSPEKWVPREWYLLNNENEGYSLLQGVMLGRGGKGIVLGFGGELAVKIARKQRNRKVSPALKQECVDELKQEAFARETHLQPLQRWKQSFDLDLEETTLVEAVFMERVDFVIDSNGPLIAEWNYQKKWLFIQQLAQEIIALHQRGIIHGDLKPANIGSKNDKAVLLDFGSSFIKNSLDIGSPTPAFMLSEHAIGGYEERDGVSFALFMGMFLTTTALQEESKNQLLKSPKELGELFKLETSPFLHTIEWVELKKDFFLSSLKSIGASEEGAHELYGVISKGLTGKCTVKEILEQLNTMSLS